MCRRARGHVLRRSLLGTKVTERPVRLVGIRTTQFRMTVDLSRPEQFSYEQQTFMYQPRREDLYCHRDRNTLARR